jgi:hypothetical protein
VTGIGLLVIFSVIASVQVASIQLKKKSFITCDGDSTDTIIVAQERQRSRVFLDVLKKMTFMRSSFNSVYEPVSQLNLFEVRSLFMNAYQRNVFYVFALSTVP